MRTKRAKRGRYGIEMRTGWIQCYCPITGARPIIEMEECLSVKYNIGPHRIVKKYNENKGRRYIIYLPDEAAIALFMLAYPDAAFQFTKVYTLV